GMVEQVFFDGVFVEPGDGAQAAGDSGPGPAAGLHVPGEALNVGAAGLGQGEGGLLAPAGGLGAGPGIRPPGQARGNGPGPVRGPGVPARVTLARASRAWWMWTWWPWRPSRVGLRPGKAGPAVAPATMLHFTGKRAPAITQGHHAIPTVAPCWVCAASLRRRCPAHAAHNWGFRRGLTRSDPPAPAARIWTSAHGERGRS